jgi:hypothetical protein
VKERTKERRREERAEEKEEGMQAPGSEVIFVSISNEQKHKNNKSVTLGKQGKREIFFLKFLLEKREEIALLCMSGMRRCLLRSASRPLLGREEVFGSAACRSPLSTRASPSGGSIVIAGGGVVGSSVAYFVAHALRSRGHTLDASNDWTVTVVERDPCYTFASSTLSASSIRHQFSTPENVLIGQYGSLQLYEPLALLATETITTQVWNGLPAQCRALARGGQ